VISLPSDPKRDGNGRFTPGTAPGPGRPRREHETRRLESIRTAVSDEDFATIIAKAVDQAKAGNQQARAWLSEYLLPPRQLLVQGMPSTTVTVQQSAVIDPISEMIRHASTDQLVVIRQLLIAQASNAPILDLSRSTIA